MLMWKHADGSGRIGFFLSFFSVIEFHWILLATQSWSGGSGFSGLAIEREPVANDFAIGLTFISDFYCQPMVIKSAIEHRGHYRVLIEKESMQGVLAVNGRVIFLTQGMLTSGMFSFTISPKINREQKIALQVR